MSHLSLSIHSCRNYWESLIKSKLFIPLIQRIPHKILIRQLISAIVLSLLTIGWIIIMMVIAANQPDLEDKITWLLQFFQILIQDLIVSPFITLGTQYMIYHLMRKVKLFSSQKTSNFLRESLGYPFIEIIVKKPALRPKFKRSKSKMPFS